MTRYGPDVIHKCPNRPLARLHEDNDRRAQTEFSLPKDACLGRRRQKQLRPYAPDQLAPLWGQEECGLHVSEAIEPGLRANGLENNRRDPSDDEVPVLPEADRNHRLDVQNVLDAFARPDVEVPVFLEGNADEASDWILCSFPEGIGICRRRWRFLRGDLGPGHANGRILRCQSASAQKKARQDQEASMDEDRLGSDRHVRKVFHAFSSPLEIASTRSLRAHISSFDVLVAEALDFVLSLLLIETDLGCGHDLAGALAGGVKLYLKVTERVAGAAATVI